MSRSKWKGNFIENSIVNYFHKSNTEDSTVSVFNTKARHSIIPAVLEGHTIFVHTGKDYRKLKIIRERIGFKIGEFSLTRKHTAFKKKTKK